MEYHGVPWAVTVLDEHGAVILWLDTPQAYIANKKVPHKMGPCKSRGWALLTQFDCQYNQVGAFAECWWMWGLFGLLGPQMGRLGPLRSQKRDIPKRAFGVSLTCTHCEKIFCFGPGRLLFQGYHSLRKISLSLGGPLISVKGLNLP